MSCELMLDDIIMNLFSDTTKRKINSAQNNLFSKIRDDKIYLYQVSLQDYSWKKRFYDTKKTQRTHHFIEKGIFQKYLGGFLSINIDEKDL